MTLLDVPVLIPEPEPAVRKPDRGTRGFCVGGRLLPRKPAYNQINQCAYGSDKAEEEPKGENRREKRLTIRDEGFQAQSEQQERDEADGCGPPEHLDCRGALRRRCRLLLDGGGRWSGSGSRFCRGGGRDLWGLRGSRLRGWTGLRG